MISKKRVLTPLSVLLLATLAACGQSAPDPKPTDTPEPQGGSEQESPVETATIRVAYSLGTQANFYHALEHDLFADHGIDVDATKFTSGPDLITALVSGSADVGVFGGPAIMTANATGADLQIFTVGNDSGEMEALYVTPDSGIGSIEDLRGKSVATIKNSTPDFVLHYALAAAEIPFDEVDVQYLGGQALVPAFLRGDVDAVWAFNSIGAQLLSAGAELVYAASDMGLPDPTSFMAKSDFVKENEGALTRFVQAILDATPIVNDDPEAAAAALVAYAGLSEEQAQIINDVNPGTALSRDQLLDPQNRVSLTPGGGLQNLLQAQAETLHMMGVIDEVPDVSVMVTDAIVQATSQ